MPELTTTEKRQLKYHMDRFNNSMREAYDSLMVIRDNRLYRDECGTFEEFCRKHWGDSKRHVNRILRHLMVVEEANLGPIGPKITESATRELSSLPIPEAAQVVREAADTAPKDSNGQPKVTAKHVRETREKKTPKKPKPKEVNTAKSVDLVTTSYISPAIREIDNIAEQLGWKRKSARTGNHLAANDALNALLAALKGMRKGEL